MVLNSPNLTVNILRVVSNSEVQYVLKPGTFFRDRLSLLFVQRVHDIYLQPNFEEWVVSSHLNLLYDTCTHVVIFVRVETLNYDTENYMIPNLLLDRFGDSHTKSTVDL